VKFSDIGGIDTVLEEIQQVDHPRYHGCRPSSSFWQLVEWPLIHPEIYTHLGVLPPRGVLLCGPSGTGKTKLANAIAGELAAFGVKFFRVSAPSLVTGAAFCFPAKIMLSG
jgi:ribosome biogenesis ATPase